MLFVSIFTSERSLDPEFWATAWHGDPPPGVKVIGAYNLTNDKRVYVWEGDGPEDIQYMDRFNEVGLLETYPAIDRTSGFRTAIGKDLDGFRRVLESRGRSDAQIESAIELRRRAMEAPNRHTARSEARRWQEDPSRVDDR